jgi:hypothetical protein
MKGCIGAGVCSRVQERAAALAAPLSGNGAVGLRLITAAQRLSRAPDPSPADALRISRVPADPRAICLLQPGLQRSAPSCPGAPAGSRKSRTAGQQTGIYASAAPCLFRTPVIDELPGFQAGSWVDEQRESGVSQSWMPRSLNRLGSCRR